MIQYIVKAPNGKKVYSGFSFKQMEKETDKYQKKYGKQKHFNLTALVREKGSK